MQNSNDVFNDFINKGVQPKPATPKQIEAMKKMGFTGVTDGMTAQDASAWIGSHQNNQPQHNQGSYTAPSYQPSYQAPPMEPKQQGQGFHAPQNFTGSDIVTYETRDGQVMELTPDVINLYICQQPLNAPEMQYFLSVCKTYQLNPFLKDIYAIKFGQQPATFVINYQVLQQMADNHPDYDGLKTGLVILDKNGMPYERVGSYLLPGETLLGAWCDVYRKSRKNANRVYSMYEENIQRTKEGNPNKNWATKPVFMITKVAKAQALREAFPNMFANNVYTSDEISDDEETKRVSKDYKNNSINAVVKEQQTSMASVKPTLYEDENGVVTEENDFLGDLAKEYGN